MSLVGSGGPLCKDTVTLLCMGNLKFSSKVNSIYPFNKSNKYVNGNLTSIYNYEDGHYKWKLQIQIITRALEKIFLPRHLQTSFLFCNCVHLCAMSNLGILLGNLLIVTCNDCLKLYLLTILLKEKNG